MREPGGLGLWVYPSGRRSWVYTYRYAGRKERLVLGEYPAIGLASAREAAGKARAQRAEGQSPRAARAASRRAQSAILTVAGLLERYERWAKPRKRAWEKERGFLALYILPEWGDRRAEEVTRREVRDLLARVALRAPISANRTLSALRAMYGWAEDEELIEASPCWRIRAPTRERARERVLSVEEIGEAWARFGSAGFPVDPGRALQLVLVTAQRPGEVAGISREEIAGEWWTIPPERAKNGRSHRVPLSALALEIVGDGAGQIFRPMASYVLPQTLDRHRGPLAHFTPHDLRRTAASHMAGMGVPRLVIHKILGHSDRDITAVYDRHSYDREKQEALEAWARRLREITGNSGCPGRTCSRTRSRSDSTR